jgi:hypothetical protein
MLWDGNFFEGFLLSIFVHGLIAGEKSNDMLGAGQGRM